VARQRVNLVDNYNLWLAVGSPSSKILQLSVDAVHFFSYFLYLFQFVLLLLFGATVLHHNLNFNWSFGIKENQRIELFSLFLLFAAVKLTIFMIQIAHCN